MIGIFNRKNKGPSAKDYFNTEANGDKSKRPISSSNPEVADAGGKGSKTKLNFYDSFCKILENLIMHKVLLEC